MRDLIHFHPGSEPLDDREPLPCTRADCQLGIHYHWGYGQRHTSDVPVTGDYAFSDGQPYLKEESS